MATKTLAPEVAALSDVLNALASLGTPDEKQWVLQTASNRVGVALAPSTPNRLTTTPMKSPAGAGGAGATPKDFMRVKDPNSDVQRVACLAYYLTHHRDTPQFKSVDLSALNTEAAGPKFNMSRAVNNATNQNSYLTSAGGGRKQITARGEDVANALPSQEAVKAVETAKQKRRKKSVAKKAKK